MRIDWPLGLTLTDISDPASGGDKKAASGGSTRVSKAAAVEALAAAITDAGQEADEEILSKLTGKAAQYFTAVITAVNK